MTPKLTNVDSGPTSVMQAQHLQETMRPQPAPSFKKLNIASDGTIYFGDIPFTAKHVELLDRLLRQEFPEEFI